MSELVWDQVGDRLYETGINKGVLYEPNGNGVVWNGLIGVEANEADEVEHVFYDGVKINDVVTIGEFSGILRAYTYPDEFLRYEGTLEGPGGLYLRNQSHSRFCLTYQTRIGDDVVGTELGYKIHILYNLTAFPSARSYQTMSVDTEAIEFEWNVYSVPEDVENFRPTANIVIDSRKFWGPSLIELENILYGTDLTEPHLPPLQSLISFFS